VIRTEAGRTAGRAVADNALPAVRGAVNNALRNILIELLKCRCSAIGIVLVGFVVTGKVVMLLVDGRWGFLKGLLV
jgi:hypothetical protein